MLLICSIYWFNIDTVIHQITCIVFIHHHAAIHAVLGLSWYLLSLPVCSEIEEKKNKLYKNRSSTFWEKYISTQ